MRSRDLRTLPLAAVTWAVAGCAVLLPDRARMLTAGVLIAAAVVVVLLWRHRPRAAALVAVAAAFGAVSAAHVAIVQPQRAAALARATDGAAVVEVTAEVTTKVRRVDASLWLDAATTTLTVRGREQRARVPVTIAIRAEDAPGIDLGSVLRVRGSARAAGVADEAVLVVFADRTEVIRPPPGLLGIASALREGFTDEVIAGLPEPGAGLLPGLAIGDTAEVSSELDAAMKTVSLTHLTAVSAANCSLVVALAFGCAVLLRAPRWARVAVATAALGGFVLLVTPEPSVVRAAAMTLIAMLALLLGRRGAGIAALSMTVVLVLWVDPWFALSYGFVLSVLATAALLLLAAPLAAGLSRWMPRALALGIAVPLSAQLVCGPVILLLSPQLPVYGVVANLLAAPAAPIATVIGMLACVLQGVPFLADGLAALAWLPSAWIAQTAGTLAALPAASVPWWGGAAGFVALSVVHAGFAVLVIAPPGRGGQQWLRRGAASLLAVVVGTAAGSTALSGVAAPLTAPRDWSVAMCDVGQGDATVIRSEGAVALVDTGPDPALLTDCLTTLGVSHIDLLVLTHFDLDHVGAVDAVAGRVDTVLHGPLDADGARWVERAGGDAVEAGTGMTGTLGGAMWRVLWPREAQRAFEPGNDTSVVVEVAGGGVPRTLLLGDLSALPQSLMASSASPGTEIVKVSHHGSADQDDGLYRRIAARIALIGVGAGNDYDHPTDAALRLLSETGTTVARTDRDGLLLAGRDATGSLWLWREHGPP